MKSKSFIYFNFNFLRTNSTYITSDVTSSNDFKDIIKITIVKIKNNKKFKKGIDFKKDNLEIKKRI